MPSLSPSVQEDELALELAALKEELQWFMSTQVKPSLNEIHRALLACQESSRLQDDTKGALTLAISSASNDTMKGFITVAGSYIVRGELVVKLPKQPVVKAAIHAQVPGNTMSASVTEAITPTTTSTLSAPTATAVAFATTVVAATAVSKSTLGSSNDSSAAHASDRKSPPLSPPTTTSTVATEPLSNIQDSHQLLQNAIVANASGRATAGTHVRDSSVSSSSSGSGTVTMTTTVVPITALTTTGGGGLAPHQLLNPYKAPGHLTQPYFLEQIKDIQNHLAQALFRLDDFWAALSSSGTSSLSDAHSASHPSPPIELSAVQTLLQLLRRHLRGAIENLARPSKEKLYPFRVCDPKIFTPPLNEDFVLEFYIRDAKVVCAAYALQLSMPPPSVGGGGGGNGTAQHPQPSTTHPAPPSQQHQYHQDDGLPRQQQQTQHSLPLLRPPPPAATSGGMPTFLGHHQRTYSQPTVSRVVVTGEDGGGGDGSTDYSASSNMRPPPPRPSPFRSPSTFTENQADQGGGGGFPWSSPAKSPPQSSHAHQASFKSGVVNGGTGGNATGPSTTANQGKTSGGANYLAMLSSVMASDGSAPLALDKIGLTTKGGINKYRGKIATTMEEVTVQVQNPKLDDIRSKLVHAEALCLDLSTRLQVFVQ